MDMRMEQQPHHRPVPAPTRQTAMQARQTQQLDKMVEQQQATAIIIERVVGRLDALEHWREELVEERQRQDERRDDRMDRQPDSLRSALSTYGGCLSNLIYAALTSISLLIGSVGLIIAIVKH